MIAFRFGCFPTCWCSNKLFTGQPTGNQEAGKQRCWSFMHRNWGGKTRSGTLEGVSELSKVCIHCNILQRAMVSDTRDVHSSKHKKHDLSHCGFFWKEDKGILGRKKCIMCSRSFAWSKR